MSLDSVNIDTALLLIKILVIGYVAIRWGGLICVLFCIYFLCTEQWTYATLAFIYGAILECIKATVTVLERATGRQSGPNA